MPISFSNIPSNIKVPLYWVEVDPSKAGLSQLNLRALLVGVKIAAGTASADVPIPIGSQAQADAAFGVGSELARMFLAYFANNFANEVWGLPVAEPAAGTAATGTITVTGAPTAAGTINLYIAGEPVRVNITTVDTPTTIAAAIVSAITNYYATPGNPGLPVTATAAAGVVTLTSRFKGVNGNEISVILNYYGTVGSEFTPAGITIVLPAGGVLGTGAGVPVFTTCISNIEMQDFEYVAMPYTDSNSLVIWDQEFGFTDTGRWGWERQQFGHIFSAKRGTYAALITFGGTMNSAVESIMGWEVSTASPTFECAAAYTGKAQRALFNDPARPLQTLSLNRIKGCLLTDRFDFVEMNSLASTGIAIQQNGSDNQPMILREQTTYRLNLYGQSDDAYELVTT
jgi:phage tail sheath gpL-like